MSWVTAPDHINPEFTTALIELADWLELDGYELDYEVIYFDDYASLEIEIYLDGILAGVAHHFDDITRVIDNYYEEGADN